MRKGQYRHSSLFSLLAIESIVHCIINLYNILRVLRKHINTLLRFNYFDLYKNPFKIPIVDLLLTSISFSRVPHISIGCSIASASLQPPANSSVDQKSLSSQELVSIELIFHSKIGILCDCLTFLLHSLLMLKFKSFSSKK